jgi:hypothetical protein
VLLAAVLGASGRGRACEYDPRAFADLLEPPPAAPVVIAAGLERSAPVPGGPASSAELWVRLEPPERVPALPKYHGDGEVLLGGLPAEERARPLAYRIEVVSEEESSWVMVPPRMVQSTATGELELRVPTRTDPVASRRPVSFAFRVSAVDADGDVGPASPPVWVGAAGAFARRSSPRPDQALCLILLFSLLGLWQWYRSESSQAARVRVAAASALCAVLFLSATGAMPWFSVHDPGGRTPEIECYLGTEQACASYLPDAHESMTGGDPLERARRHFQLYRWSYSAHAIHLGQAVTVLFLVPALIWLLVAPVSRMAQASMAVGAFAAGFTLLVSLFYVSTRPGWLSADSYWTFDLVLLAASNIAVAAVLILRSGFTAVELPSLPAALARLRRRPRSASR